MASKSRSSSKGKAVVKRKASKSKSKSSSSRRASGVDLVADFVQTPNGWQKQYIPRAEYKRREESRRMYLNAPGLTDEDQYFASQASGAGLTGEGRPACIPGLQFRNRHGKCVPIPTTSTFGAMPSNTGVSWVGGDGYTTRSLLSNGRVLTVPSMYTGSNTDASRSDLEDSRLKAWRLNYAGAPWKPYAGAYRAGECPPGKLLTPDGQCVERSSMYGDGWTAGTYNSKPVARPPQLSFMDYSAVNGGGRYGQSTAQYSDAIQGPVRRNLNF